jgi:hypothetical protein
MSTEDEYKDDGVDSTLESASACSRRSLLSVATGCLALTAGGMVAPPGRQAVLAGNKHKNSGPPSGINTQEIGFEIQNHRGAAVLFQVWRWDANKQRWNAGDPVTLDPDDTDFLRGSDGRLAYRFADGQFVLGRDANQQTVLLEIGDGACDMSGCARDHLLASQRLHEEESVSAATITVTRL